MAWASARAHRHSEEPQEAEELDVAFAQWTELSEGAGYTASGKTVGKLPPGFYDLKSVQGTIIWQGIKARTDKLLPFPDSAVKEVLIEIETFWDREKAFVDHGLPYKRGILLWGPAGSGKSSTLQLLARQVVKQKGVVIMFSDANLFIGGLRQLRDIQPEVPVVVLMEDLDAIIERQNESTILNLLDGVESVHKCVFVATTNWPEKLGARIVNRPSRFDRRFKIPHPSDESRRMYLQDLMLEGDDMDVEQMVRDSDGMSLAHLKELFVATAILGGEYSQTVRILKGMKDRAHSAKDEEEFEEVRSGQYA